MLEVVADFEKKCSFLSQSIVITVIRRMEDWFLFPPPQDSGAIRLRLVVSSHV